MAENFGELGRRASAELSNLTTVTRQTQQALTEFNPLLGSPQTVLAIPTRLFREPLSDVSNNLDVALNENLNQFQQSINDTIGQIDPALGFSLPNVAVVSTEVSTGVNQIASQIDGSIDDFISNLGSVANQITDNFSGQFGQLSGALTNITEGLTGFTSAVPNFTRQLSNALPSLPEDFGQVSQSFSSFNNQLQSASGQISSAIESASAFTNPGQFLQNTLDNVVDAGLERILGVVGNITNIGSLFSNFLPGSNRAISVLSDAFETITTGLSGERLQDYEDALEDLFNNSDTSVISSGALLSGNISGSNLLGNQTFNSGASTSSKFATSAEPNKLRQHNTYNYIITLGCISPNSYSTGEYRTVGLDNIVLRSGGGALPNEDGVGLNLSSRVRTADEQVLDKDLEYFIDDLEIDAVIAPNPNTGVSLGTTIKFKVVEPYSMSQFLEALQVSASACSYRNYINATFCLKIEFVGWDEFGKESVKLVEKPIYIPIKLINMDFNITASGSEYEVTAISYGEVATYDTVNNTLVQIGTNGYTVADTLENSNNSVTGIMNDHLEQLEQDGSTPKMHRYLILFPKTETAILDTLRTTGDIDVERLTSDPAAQEAIRQGTGDPTAEFSDPDTKLLVEDFFGAPPIYRKLKYFSLIADNINVIGMSPLKTDSNEGSNQIPTPSGSMIDQDGLVFRASPEAEPTQNSRRFDYNEGNRITGIIEDIILSSQYAKDTSERIATGRESNEIGKYPWFRIEPMTFVEQTGAIESQTGTPVYTYVYAIHPYEIDEAKFIGPGGTPRGTDELRRRAKKVYNYFYTGQNEDILNFDINFNMAFFNAIGGDMENNRTPGGSDVTGEVGSRQKAFPPGVSTDVNIETTSPIVMTNRVSGRPRGSRDGRVSESERRRAETLHDRIINSTVDMVTAEMEIWGDPYFIPNYQGSEKETNGNILINDDGTMSYTKDEINVVVNFRTPLDYQINGFVMNFPELVKPFSGIFNAWAVTNVFAEGKFTQTLKLIRRQGQSNDTEFRPLTGLDPNRTGQR